MNDKRIESINTNQPVPKKTKIVQSKNQAPAEAGGSPAGMKIRKTPAARRTSTTRKTKSPVARTEKVSMPAEAGRWRTRRTTQFVSAPTSSPNAGADLRCRATQNTIGSKRNDMLYLTQALGIS